MEASDGKIRLTDVAETQQLQRLIQSIPSPKVEPFKQWLARVGYERIEATDDPESPWPTTSSKPWVPLQYVRWASQSMCCMT